jgi:hypothetical protein
MRTIINASAWSFVGILVTVGIFYWQEYRNPFDFKIELVDQFNLVEVKEKISDLKILYKNEDMLIHRKAIKVVRISFVNNGKTILQSYYDQLQPFGLRLMKSKILNAEVLESNSEDLRKNFIANFSSHSGSEYSDLLFSKLIFDSGDFVKIKITLIQSSEENLDITPLGKLANIGNLTISSAKIEAKNPISTWIYILAGYLGLIVISVLVISISEFVESQSKKKHLNKYIKNHGKLGSIETEIANLYLNMGNRNLRLISALLKSDFVINISEFVNQKKDGLAISTSFFSVFLKSPSNVYYELPKEIFSVDGTNVAFNEANLEFLRSFFGEVLA